MALAHSILCSGDVNVPTYSSGTAVGVSGAVECWVVPGTGPGTASVDIADTYITVQIYENGAWRNYGNPTYTSSTAKTLILTDGAPGKKGTWKYRGRIHREAFHGTWDADNWYGPSRTMTF